MAAKDRKGLLIDYYYCTGCRSCEVACAVEHALPLGEFGIKVQEVGPWEYAKGSRGGDQKNWQLSYIPMPTDQCDLCAERVLAGKQPSCVHNCQASSSCPWRPPRASPRTMKVVGAAALRRFWGKEREKPCSCSGRSCRDTPLPCSNHTLGCSPLAASRLE